MPTTSFQNPGGRKEAGGKAKLTTKQGDFQDQNGTTPNPPKSSKEQPIGIKPRPWPAASRKT